MHHSNRENNYNKHKTPITAEQKLGHQSTKYSVHNQINDYKNRHLK